MTREDKLREAIEEYIGYACEVDECINTTKQRVAFADGANWQYHQFIEKACEWLENIDLASEYFYDGEGFFENAILVEEFKKAMEE